MTIILEVYLNHDDSQMPEDDGSTMTQLEIDDDNIANLAHAVLQYQKTDNKLKKPVVFSLDDAPEQFFAIAPYLETHSTANEILNAIARTDSRQQALDMLCDFINARFYIKVV